MISCVEGIVEQNIGPSMMDALVALDIGLFFIPIWTKAGIIWILGEEIDYCIIYYQSFISIWHEN